MDNQTLIELIAFLTGVFLIFFGYSKIQGQKYLLQNGIKTEGTIVNFKSTGNMSSPVINYEINDNKSITKEYSIASNVGHYKKGDSVPIIYDPIKNDRFIIDNNSTKRLGLIFIIIGIVLVAYSIVSYFFKIPVHS